MLHTAVAAAGLIIGFLAGHKAQIQALARAAAALGPDALAVLKAIQAQAKAK